MALIDRNALLEDENVQESPDIRAANNPSVSVINEAYDAGEGGARFKSGTPLYWNTIIHEIGRAATAPATGTRTYKLILATGSVKPANTGAVTAQGVRHFTSTNATTTITDDVVKAYEITLDASKGPQFITRQIGFGPDWLLPGDGYLRETLRQWNSVYVEMEGNRPRIQFTSWIDASPLTDPAAPSKFERADGMDAEWFKSGNTMGEPFVF